MCAWAAWCVPKPFLRPASLQSKCGWVDFGPEVGERKTSAQVTTHYDPDSLVGRQVMAVVNFPPRQIGPFMSEVLVLGFPDAEGAIVLATPDKDVPVGGRLH